MASYSTYRVSVKEPGRDWKTLGSESATSKSAVKRYFGPFPRGTKWRITKARESMYERVNSGNSAKRKHKKKKSVTKRVSASFTQGLKKLNPAFKRASSVRVKKLKGGGVTITPVR
jgi:hypothetical protein